MSVLRNGEKAAVRAKNVNPRNKTRKARYRQIAVTAKRKKKAALN